MSASLREILAHVDELLEPGRFSDYCVNGLQVPGREDITTIATGVSAHAELFELAASAEADLVLVHHGLFWGEGVAAIDPILKRRLQLLFDGSMALAAYHLPLDAHPVIGNNALIAEGLGATRLTPFARHRGQPIGFLADLPDGGSPAAELFSRVGRLTGREPLVFSDGPATVARVGIVSGAGGDHIDEALAGGAQALITGEVAERTMALARESAIHVIAAGHHATETFGIRRLGEHLAESFDVEEVFFDVPNPL